ncbi:hypothetical protein ACFX15_022160 [Malus domestica]
MAYIISVNATILTDSGSTCSIADYSTMANQTVTPDCMIISNEGYQNCLAKTKSDLISSADSLNSRSGSKNSPVKGLSPGLIIPISVADMDRANLVATRTAKN